MSDTNFAAIGQLVTEGRNLLDAIKGGAISAMQTQFDRQVEEQERDFAEKVASYESRVNQATAPLMQVINGRDVYRVGDKHVYGIKHYVADGGYQAGANKDPAFPNVKDPTLPVSYFNLIEFVANSGFGSQSDTFKVEFYQTHRGMNSSNYVDHFVFTGASVQDSVSGFLEVKKTTEVGGLCLFISQPSGNREVRITRDMEGQRIPISLRDIGQGYDRGTARLSLKVDTRYYAGATRAFYLHGEYTSDRGQPPAKLYNKNAVHWSR
ncbi:hypothetical protein B6A42_02440 [Vibrio coralliilyticus]|nr:hypothetical protein B6A42_02440 [Vibrio coralliilyticus]